jgi:hypothetical protein
VAWTGVAFVYRWAEKKQANRMFMGLGMGVAGTALAVAYVLVRGIDLHEAQRSQAYLGLALSVLAMIGIPLFMAAVARGDLSISWTVLSLSFSLASVLSMLYPRAEKATASGVVALALAAAAVALLGVDMYERHRSNGPSRPRRGWGFFMTFSFVNNALSLYGFKLAVACRPETPAESPANDALFLVAMYGLWMAWSLPAAIWTRKTGSVKNGFSIGLIGGAILFTGGLLTLFAFEAGVPGFVFFPATTGGSNVLVVVISVFFLRERPGRSGWLGIAAGLAAIVCLGLGMK